jgi:hypothetical protein
MILEKYKPQIEAASLLFINSLSFCYHSRLTGPDDYVREAYCDRVIEGPEPGPKTARNEADE